MIIYIENNSYIPIGKRVYDYLQDYFKDTSLSYDIQNLLDKNWCKETFNISYPLLKEIDDTKNLKDQTIPDGKSGAYYAQNPILHINSKLYIIYMQWNDKMHRNRIEKWIAENPIDDKKTKNIIYIISKEKAKDKYCPCCNLKAEHKMYDITYTKDNITSLAVINHLQIMYCEHCNKKFMNKNVYKTYTQTKNLDDIDVKFIELK